MVERQQRSPPVLVGEHDRLRTSLATQCRQLRCDILYSVRDLMNQRTIAVNDVLVGSTVEGARMIDSHVPPHSARRPRCRKAAMPAKYLERSVGSTREKGSPRAFCNSPSLLQVSKGFTALDFSRLYYKKRLPSDLELDRYHSPHPFPGLISVLSIRIIS